MKIRLRLFIPLFAIALLFTTACYKPVSETTGWEYNNPDNGGYEVWPSVEQETGPGLVLIEGGTFTMGRTEQDVLFDWNNVPRRVTVASYYMDMTEVRNVDYREYLYWTSRVYIDFPEIYQNALPDTLVWRRPLAYNEPYVEYYFRHPSYNDYPVVGVSWKQAVDYCAWRSDRVNEMILVRQGILEMDPNQQGENNFNTDAYLAGQYPGIIGRRPLKNLDPNNDDPRIARMEDGIILPKYRLPTEAEWEYAAYSLIGNSIDERIFNRRLYPWNGHYLRNDGFIDGKIVRGQMMSNFQRGRGDYMGVAGYLNDNAPVTAPVDSYWPNDFGLYCMAGNVNEWVLDVYRAMSSLDVSDFRPFRGNIFMTLDRDPAGNVREKDKYGRLKYREMTADENMGRHNYHRSDNRNYLDGDVRSSALDDTDEWLSATEEPGSNRMYYQGRPDTHDGMSSLINDNARIYKGGGWRDRAYWLNPSTRRYFDENKSRDDIGFRCAMIRVGSPSGF